MIDRPFDVSDTPAPVAESSPALDCTVTVNVSLETAPISETLRPEMNEFSPTATWAQLGAVIAGVAGAEK